MSEIPDIEGRVPSLTGRSQAGELEIITPGALQDLEGKQVPAMLNWGPVIGTARTRLTGDGLAVSVQLDDSEQARAARQALTSPMSLSVADIPERWWEA